MGAQAEQVREDILSRIMNRKLMPGDRIDEDDIRARLELSVTPVREALIGLEQARVIEQLFHLVAVRHVMDHATIRWGDS